MSTTENTVATEVSANHLPDTTAVPGWKKWVRSLGPGLITAALVFGPSKITITSKLGAEFGYALLWAIVAAIFFMAVFTTMSARLGLATRQSFLQTVRARWGRTASIAIGLGVFVVCASFQAGNSIGVGIAIAEATHSSPNTWIVVFNLFAIALLFSGSFYKLLEKLMISLIIMMLLSFIVTLVVVKPDLAGIASGLVPTIPAGSSALIIALFASSFSIVGALYQSYLVQERRRVSNNNQQKSTDSITGIVILGLMASTVLICAATGLYPAGIKVNNAVDMAKALEPLFGRYAANLFLVGLFGAAFSSLVGNASVGGTLLGDALGYGHQLSEKRVKMLIALIMVIGAAVAIAFGKLPLELIVLAQTVTIFIVPFIGTAIYLLANSESVMGADRNSMFYRIAGALGLAILFFLAIIGFKDIFLK